MDSDICFPYSVAECILAVSLMFMYYYIYGKILSQVKHGYNVHHKKIYLVLAPMQLPFMAILAHLLIQIPTVVILVLPQMVNAVSPGQPTTL